MVNCFLIIQKSNYRSVYIILKIQKGVYINENYIQIDQKLFYTLIKFF